ncbi:hypothetical protein ACFP3I_15380 [Chryseobacterium arachidis]|uniref:hypothetical protein n=1 Tax=Chryseobacterium arachidis TaxID=1416778 RepID=UPI00360D4255
MSYFNNFQICTNKIILNVFLESSSTLLRKKYLFSEAYPKVFRRRPEEIKTQIKKLSKQYFTSQLHTPPYFYI